MSGFGGESQRPPAQDVASYPTFRELFQTHARKSLHTAPPRALGEVRYVDRGALDKELADYRKILEEQPRRFLEPSGLRPRRASSPAACRTSTTAPCRST